MSTDTSSPMGDPESNGRSVESLETVAIRFAGDSGDGMQLTGTQFTSTTAIVGNDLATFPDYPAEIRAPAGTVAGVSGFQIQFGSLDIHTPGDRPDVLVAMNPAALKVNLPTLEPGAMIFVNTDAFDARSCEKVDMPETVLEDDTLHAFRVFKVPFTTLTRGALEESALTTREKDRCKNFLALGLMYFVFGRPLEHTEKWLDQKFAKKPDMADANKRVLRAGFNYGVTTETIATTYKVAPAPIKPGTYRQVTGNTATAIGFVAAAKLADNDLFLGSYPITPASDILHELSKYKHFGVRTFQAEDEIAGIASAIGAAFGGSISITTTSGPGLALKGEAIGLAIMTELPLVIVNVQRGGPSTGLPTKTEQSDLLQAMYGRNGEAPMPVVAAATPADCFDTAIECVRLATKYMTPVMMLTDGYIANGAEPWRVPDVEELPKIPVQFRTEVEDFKPYERDVVTLARPWVKVGTPGLEHRIGGLEKAEGSGNVSYDPGNHEHMIRRRAEKVDRIANDIPDAEVIGDTQGDLLIVGWGGTYGALRAATTVLRKRGHKVSHMHLRHVHPMPKNVEPMLRSFGTVVAAELNLGQLRHILRERFLVDVKGLNKVQGQPFMVSEIVSKIEALLGSPSQEAVL
ncbi:MAG: 2-oxoacid:acceptor oxidoreductase subunit alpha [Deltaproteobacteria bacterium]|nr:MAG: 2-oxoacid:acceptor oxidoreductase subunit alpha [Deltaproteobacteria bacterium]